MIQSFEGQFKKDVYTARNAKRGSQNDKNNGGYGEEDDYGYEEYGDEYNNDV